MDGVEILNTVYMMQGSISPLIMVIFLAAAGLFFAIGVINFLKTNKSPNVSLVCSAIAVTILLILEVIGFGHPVETDIIDYYEIAVDEELIDEEEFNSTYEILDEIGEYSEVAPSRKYYKAKLK